MNHYAVAKHGHIHLLDPQGQWWVPVLILGCDDKLGVSVWDWPVSCGAQDERAAGLEVKGVAIKGQVVAVARHNAGGVGAGLAVVEAAFLHAVLVILAGDGLTVDAVVCAVAIAEDLAIQVYPKGLISGKLVPLKVAATLTAGDTLAALQGIALITLTPLRAAVHTDGAQGQGLTGLRARHTFLKVAVLRALQS